MAPTEILAEQHMATMEKNLAGLDVKLALLTGSTPAKEKKSIGEKIASGDISIVIGTQALLQEKVFFKDVALMVVDEQHRFGVRQRATLKQKSGSPHMLMMTATPIPRTLAMTLYGDLDVSAINERPPGRPPIGTHWTLEANAWAAVRREVESGRQAYIVFPLVEESEKMDLRAVLIEWEILKKRIFPDFTVGLLHGRMKAKEKEDVMARFKRGEIQVLAATPVIEVGIDVPNATVMVICEADRFGVAQLHQLRGRVGRGRHASSCYLVSDAKSPASADRLKLLCQTDDGFRLAEEDLKFRGPGEFLGEAQHGLLPLKVGDLLADGPLIEEAQKAALAILEADPALSTPQNRAFQEDLKQRFGDRLALGQIG
jgi:ATP-dependent DNA helicase RecG